MVGSACDETNVNYQVAKVARLNRCGKLQCFIQCIITGRRDIRRHSQLRPLVNQFENFVLSFEARRLNITSAIHWSSKDSKNTKSCEGKQPMK